MRGCDRMKYDKCMTCIWAGEFTECQRPDGVCEYVKIQLPEGYSELTKEM